MNFCLSKEKILFPVYSVEFSVPGDYRLYLVCHILIICVLPFTIMYKPVSGSAVTWQLHETYTMVSMKIGVNMLFINKL